MRRVFMLLTWAGCAVAGPQIDDRVHVVTTTPLQATDSQLVFARTGNDDLLERAPGDVLVGNAGRGFLRAVSSVEVTADQITIATTPAALDDAIIEAAYDSRLSDDKSDLSGPALDGYFFEYGDTALFGDGNLSVNVTSGHLAFHPNLDLALDITGHGVSRFDLVAGGSLDADLAFHVEGHGSAEIRHTVKNLWSSEPATFVQWIGWLPVVEVVQLNVDAIVDVGADDGDFSLDVGASGHADLQIGRRYENGEWTTVADHDLSVDRSGPTFNGQTGAHAQVLIATELDVSFYDLAGPYVAVEPKLEADYTPGEGITAGWGVQAYAGGNIKILGFGDTEKFAGFDAQLFDFECDFGKSIEQCLPE